MALGKDGDTQHLTVLPPPLATRPKEWLEEVNVAKYKSHSSLSLPPASPLEGITKRPPLIYLGPC